MRIADRQVLSLLHRILARVLPEGNDDVDGDAGYQLARARGHRGKAYTGEYWREVAGSSREPHLQARLRPRPGHPGHVPHHHVQHPAAEGTGPPLTKNSSTSWNFRVSTTTMGSKATWPTMSQFLADDGRWAELQPQVDSNDGGTPTT